MTRTAQTITLAARELRTLRLLLEVKRGDPAQWTSPLSHRSGTARACFEPHRVSASSESRQAHFGDCGTGEERGRVRLGCLARAPSVINGTEAYMVLRDVWSSSDRKIESTASTIADAFIATALAKAQNTSQRLGLKGQSARPSRALASLTCALLPTPELVGTVDISTLERGINQWQYEV
jgi:hypothetical protein